MSVFDALPRKAAAASDDAVRRYVLSLHTDLEPDPLFRRRLRGTVVNRFVAAREGIAEPRTSPSHIGRIGRACVYASFALTMGVGGVLAASRGSVPGDPLYAVKLQIEAIRMRTLPVEFHGHLALYALSERVREVGVLAEKGDWAAVADAATAVRAAYEDAGRRGVAWTANPGFAARLEVLRELLGRLPEKAHLAIENALDQGSQDAGASTPLPGGRSVERPGTEVLSNGAGAAGNADDSVPTGETVDPVPNAAGPASDAGRTRSVGPAGTTRPSPEPSGPSRRGEASNDAGAGEENVLTEP